MPNRKAKAVGTGENRELNPATRLSSLMYGHGGKHIQSLSRPFDPAKYPKAPTIQICELECGCWIIADGNNRVGLILKENPDATVGDIAKSLLSIYRRGEWDEEMMDWWNPAPRSFEEAMKSGKSQLKSDSRRKGSVYGMIEKGSDRQFTALTLTAQKRKTIIASGSSAQEAEKLLKTKVGRLLNKRNINLVLKPMNALDKHQCRSS